jgi:hypothetical protein
MATARSRYLRRFWPTLIGVTVLALAVGVLGGKALVTVGAPESVASILGIVITLGSMAAGFRWIRILGVKALHDAMGDGPTTAPPS